jgi:hypothetical protein
MINPPGDDLLAEVLDRLLELYELRADAEDRGDGAQLQFIEEEIRRAEAQRNALRHWDIVGTA